MTFNGLPLTLDGLKNTYPGLLVTSSDSAGRPFPRYRRPLIVCLALLWSIFRCRVVSDRSSNGSVLYVVVRCLLFLPWIILRTFKKSLLGLGPEAYEYMHFISVLLSLYVK